METAFWPSHLGLHVTHGFREPTGLDPPRQGPAQTRRESRSARCRYCRNNNYVYFGSGWPNHNGEEDNVEYLEANGNNSTANRNDGRGSSACIGTC